MSAGCCITTSRCGAVLWRDRKLRRGWWLAYWDETACVDGQMNRASQWFVRTVNLCQERRGRPNSFSLAVERDGRGWAREEGGGTNHTQIEKQTRGQQNLSRDTKNQNKHQLVQQFSIDSSVMKDLATGQEAQTLLWWVGEKGSCAGTEALRDGKWIMYVWGHGNKM